MVVASGRITAEVFLTLRFVPLVEDSAAGSELRGRVSESRAPGNVDSLFFRAFPDGRASIAETTTAGCLLTVLTVFGVFSLMTL